MSMEWQMVTWLCGIAALTQYVVWAVSKPEPVRSTPGPVYCMHCGAENPAGSTYCQGCGKLLAGGY
jgi:hypothetical protein